MFYCYLDLLSCVQFYLFYYVVFCLLFNCIILSGISLGIGITLKMNWLPIVHGQAIHFTAIMFGRLWIMKDYKIFRLIVLEGLSPQQIIPSSSRYVKLLNKVIFIIYHFNKNFEWIKIGYFVTVPHHLVIAAGGEQHRRSERDGWRWRHAWEMERGPYNCTEQTVQKRSWHTNT